jgi:hypothetical protein
MSFLSATSGHDQRLAAIMQAAQAQATANANNLAISGGLTNATGALSNAYNIASGAYSGALPNQLSALLQGYGGATADVSQGYGAAIPTIAGGYNTGINQYGLGLNAALEQLYGGSQQGQGLVQGGIAQGSGDVMQALRAQTGALGQGYGAAAGTLTGQLPQYNAFITPGQGAAGSLSNALGLGGPAGTAQAINQFQASPGYQAQMQAAANAVIQHASATGMTDSGNTLTALQNSAANVANQNWNSYITNLTNTAGMGFNALTGQSNVAGNLANTYGLGGQALSSAYGAAGNTVANMAYGGGNTLGNMSYNTGLGASGLTTGAYGNIANAAINQGNNLGNAYVNQGASLGNLALGQGQGISNLYGTDAAANAQLASSLLGTGMAGQYDWGTNAQVAANNQNLSALLPLINSGMMAGQQAGINTLQMLGGGIGLIGQLAGMGMGGGQTLGGSLLGGIGKLFG